MEHILKNTRQEIELTYRFSATYTDGKIGSKIRAIFGKSFLGLLKKYSKKKEEALMYYSSLYSDIAKDTQDSSILPMDIENLRTSIIYMSQSIEDCGTILKNMTAKNEQEQKIIAHEKIFFMQLLQSFNIDIITWMGYHKTELSLETNKIKQHANSSQGESEKALLALQSKRLDGYIENINTHK